MGNIESAFAVPHGRNSPSVSDSAPSQAQQLVPNGLPQTSDMSDIAREVAICNEASEMEAAMARYAESGNFADRGDADRHRVQMEALIRGRSPEQVARMERERGLV